MKTLLEFVLGIVSAILTVVVIVALVNWLFGVQIDIQAFFQGILEQIRLLFAK